MAPPAYTVVDPQSAAIGILSQKMDKLLRMMDPAMAGMSSAPAPVASTSQPSALMFSTLPTAPATSLTTLVVSSPAAAANASTAVPPTIASTTSPTYTIDTMLSTADILRSTAAQMSTPSAEVVVPVDSLSRCSMHGHDLDGGNMMPPAASSASVAPVLKEVQSEEISMKHLPDSTITVSLTPASVSWGANLVFDEMPRRYITSASSPNSVGIVLLSYATDIHEAYKVFEVLIIQTPMLLWTPFLLDSNALLRMCYTACCVFDRGKHKQGYVTMTIILSWPLPMQLLIMYSGIDMRPMPWPSFSCAFDAIGVSGKEVTYGTLICFWLPSTATYVPNLISPSSRSEGLNHLFSPNGIAGTICATYKPTDCLVSIQFQRHAISALIYLHGPFIYDGYCQLDIQGISLCDLLRVINTQSADKGHFSCLDGPKWIIEFNGTVRNWLKNCGDYYEMSFLPLGIWTTVLVLTMVDHDVLWLQTYRTIAQLFESSTYFSKLKFEKPPWPPPVHKLLIWRFTEFVLHKQCSGSMVEMFLWLFPMQVISGYMSLALLFEYVNVLPGRPLIGHALMLSYKQPVNSPIASYPAQIAHWDGVLEFSKYSKEFNLQLLQFQYGMAGHLRRIFHVQVPTTAFPGHEQSTDNNIALFWVIFVVPSSATWLPPGWARSLILAGSWSQDGSTDSLMIYYCHMTLSRVSTVATYILLLSLLDGYHTVQLRPVNCIGYSETEFCDWAQLQCALGFHFVGQFPLPLSVLLASVWAEQNIIKRSSNGQAGDFLMKERQIIQFYIIDTLVTILHRHQLEMLLLDLHSKSIMISYFSSKVYYLIMLDLMHLKGPGAYVMRGKQGSSKVVFPSDRSPTNVDRVIFIFLHMFRAKGCLVPASISEGNYSKQYYFAVRTLFMLKLWLLHFYLQAVEDP